MGYAAISANARLARCKGHAVRPQRLRDFSRSGGDRAFDLEFAPFARFTKMFRMSTPEEMRDYVSASGSVDREHLEADNVLVPIYKVFGERLWPLMEELNLTLAA